VTRFAAVRRTALRSKRGPSNRGETFFLAPGGRMDLFEDCRELERLAAYHKARKVIDGWGRGGILFGLLFLALSVLRFLLSLRMGRGLVVPDYRLIEPGLAALGLIFLAEGLWYSVRPSPRVELVGGLALLALGLANLSLGAIALRDGRFPDWPVAMLGPVGLFFAVLRFISYWLARAVRNSKYSEADLARLDELLRYVTGTKLKDATDIITFGVGVRDWRVLLGPKAALFVDMLSKRVVAARKEEVTFEQTGPVMLVGLLRATFRVREQTWKGTIAPAGFAKYLAWKLEEPSAAQETKAPPEVPTDAIKAGQHDFHA
jgi:hypothetical protein